MTRSAPISPESLERAADWLLLLEAEPERLAEFDQWLHAAPEHFSAWGQVNRAWAGLGQLPSSAPIQAPQTLPVRRVRRPRPWLAYLAAASIAGLSALFLLSPSAPWWADYRTGTAQTQILHLQDGSVLTLAPRSAVDVDLSGSTRQVTLLEGEVLFQVEHDPARPFQVAADGAVIRVLGTEFDVRLNPSTLKVDVREGAVGVKVAEAAYRLGAGERLLVERDSGRGTQSAIAPGNVASWVSGKQYFENVTVAEVIDELRRYHHGWILLDDTALEARRVTGLYDVRDPYRALQALAEPLGADLQRYSLLLVVKKP